MKLRKASARTVRGEVCAVGLALLAGALYYLACRGGALPSPLAALAFVPEAPRLPDPTAGTFPSFVHGLAMALVLRALPLPVRTRLALLAAHLALTVGLEATLGTPDVRDVIATLAGTALAWPVSGLLRWRTGSRAPERTARSGPLSRRLALGAPALLCSVALTVGSDSGYTNACALYDESGLCEQRKRAANPVYMDYATLRDAIEVQPPRALDAIGQLHAFGDYLFVGERQQGVHVIDNTEPATPRNVGFIRIPGNTEIAIRGRYLYADSYVDLVTLDIGDPGAVRVVDRQVDIFPWDAYQSVPYDIGFVNGADPSRGVVVTYEWL